MTYMNHHHKKNEQFYGSTTIGERGQIVIPSEARETMNLKQGDKLLAFGMGEDMLVLARISQVEKMAANLANRLDNIRKAVGHASAK
jgi:AbrB family looped-hinge helix DNA binding protein